MIKNEKKIKYSYYHKNSIISGLNFLYTSSNFKQYLVLVLLGVDGEI